MTKTLSQPELLQLIEAVAVSANLPGRVTAGGNRAPSRLGKNGQPKTPTAAPSAALLRMAVAELPNDKGYFDNWYEWIATCHAIKGAALTGGYESEGRDAWLDFCVRWVFGGDAAKDKDAWDGIKAPHVGWGTLMRTLERVNPEGRERVRVAEAKHAFEDQTATNMAALSSTALTPVAAFTPASIPPRAWLYGRMLIKGFVSMLVAPGGAGKSALAMLDAVAMASGKTLRQGGTPLRPLRVWLHNAEDPADEQQRRLLAAMKHHGVTFSEIGDRLILSSGRDTPIRLARFGKDGAEVMPGVVDFIVGEAVRLNVDVIILDPLGAMHGLPENANEAINLLAGVFREIADRTGAAILLLHHVGKMAAMDMDAAGAGAARGASALVDAVRVSSQLVRMTTKEAGQFGVPDGDRRDYFRVENGKANLSRAADATWLRFLPIKLMNVTQDYPLGDEVATVENWTPPTMKPGTANEIISVQAVVAAASKPPRADVRSPLWIGWLIADALGLDAGHHGMKAAERSAEQSASYARVRNLLQEWMRDGYLIEGEEVDGSRQPRKVIRVGVPGSAAMDGGRGVPATDHEHDETDAR